ncbi:unnamed protein product [Phaedon cochleariae]|uniref:MADF domain-containing protein n=1 Tax=Phaedon cochleariae TaxID=80249 RepID=A0A9P0GYC9_PHACE|nr:unnamed protein product [Phaedon cochleariae]
MSLEEGTLIEMIEKFPHLWDKKNPSYKDKIAIENSWKTISEIMSLTVEECQDMWKSIRLKFIRERRLIKNRPSGSGAYSCTWTLYEKLGFLHDVVTTRKTKGNIKKHSETLSTPSDVWEDIIMVDADGEVSQEISNSDNEMSQDPDPQSETELSQEMPSTSKRTLSNITNLPSSSSMKGKQPKKRKSDVPLDQLVETCSSVGKSITNFFKSSPDSNIGKDDYHFGLSVAESISKIKDERKKLGIKAEIFVIISDAIAT